MKILFLTLTMMANLSALAEETKYENYDCKFTNEEVQAAFKKPIFDYFESLGIELKADSFAVTDSLVNPQAQFTIPFLFAKKINFEVSTGEKLALQSFGRYGDLNFINSGPTLDGLLLQQAKYTTYDNLGNFVRAQCVLSVMAEGGLMVFKNIGSDTNLIELTKNFNKQMGKNLNALTAKDVP